MAISSVRAGSSSRKLSRIGYGAYVAGGYTTAFNITTIQKLEFAKDFLTTLSGTLSNAAAEAGAVQNNNVAGYILGGNTFAGTSISAIDKVTFPSETKSALGASLPAARSGLGGGASNTGSAGYVLGGTTTAAPGGTAAIIKLAYSGESVSTLSATISFNRRRGYDISNDGTAGYGLGGYNDSLPGASNVIAKLLFSTETRTNLSATLTDAQFDLIGFSNTGVAGYAIENRSTQTNSKLDYSTETKTSLSAKISTQRSWAAGGANSGVAGYVFGGYISAWDATIDKWSFATDTSSLLLARLSTATTDQGVFTNSARL